jgi:hypothetical protein
MRVDSPIVSTEGPLTTQTVSGTVERLNDATHPESVAHHSPTVADRLSRSDAWPYFLAPCASTGLRLFDDIDFSSPRQDCTEILVELRYGSGSVGSGERKQTSPPGNFGHNKTMPHERFLWGLISASSPGSIWNREEVNQ